MYSSIIHHLYIVFCVHHPKSNLLLSPFIPFYPLLPSIAPCFPLVITILLSVSMSIKKKKLIGLSY